MDNEKLNLLIELKEEIVKMRNALPNESEAKNPKEMSQMFEIRDDLINLENCIYKSILLIRKIKKEEWWNSKAKNRTRK